ncbi:MAG: DNRLRE domain-containing protein [Verrucomicrobiota bacterium]
MKTTISLLVLLLVAGRPHAAEYYVDAKNGLDSNQGTLALPFRTIARASSQLKPGDTCILRAGTYRETLVPTASGEAGRPISYKPYQQEKVILSALDPVTGWQPDKDGVYKATAPKGTRDSLLLVDGQRAIEARWPKAQGSFLEALRAEVEAVSNSGAVEKGMDTIADSRLPDHKPANWLQEGKIWYLQWYNGWWAEKGKIRSFDPVKKTITLEKMILSSDRKPNPHYKFTYVVSGTRALLDADNEWVYEAKTKQIFYRASGGVNPSSLQIEVSSRQSVVDLSGKKFIVIQNIEGQGGNVMMNETTTDCRLQGMKLLYQEGSKMNGKRNEIRDSELAFSKSRAMLVIGGERNRVVNNYFHHLSEEGCAIAVLMSGNEQLFAYNTMEKSGDRMLGINTVHSQIVHNFFRDASFLARDSNCLGAGMSDGEGTEIAYNQCMTDYRRLLYINGIYLDNAAAGFIVHHNVIPVLAMNEPKVNVLVYNNTIYRFSDYNPNPEADFDSVNEKYKRSMPVGHGGDYAGCQWVNNIFGFNVTPFAGQTYVANLSSINPAEVFNDKSGKPIDKLEEPWNYDFTLKPGSPAIGAGVPLEGITEGAKPDIGAYPFGKPAWQAGCDLKSPRDIAFVRPQATFLNLLVNHGFEEKDTLAPWVSTGTKSAQPFRTKGACWHNPASDPAFRLFGAAQLGAGANGLEQTVANLKPGSDYQYWAWVKPTINAQKVQIGVRDAAGKETTATLAKVTGWTRLYLHFKNPAGGQTATVFVKKLSDDPEHLFFDEAFFSREWIVESKSDLPPGVIRFPAVEDTYVDAGRPEQVFGYSKYAPVQEFDKDVGKRGRRPFLKFDLSSLKGKTIQKATLRFNTTAGSTMQFDKVTFAVLEVPDETWSARGEKPITWNTQPKLGNLITKAPFPKAGWVEIDLTDYVRKRLAASGIISLALSDAQRSGQYVGIGTSQMMMNPPVPTDPPVIEVVK